MNNVYEQVQSLIGKESSPKPGPDKVDKATIRHWCETMEDENPLYTDEEIAEKSEYKGIIAPPQMVQSYCMSPIWPIAETVEKDSFATAVDIMQDAGYFGIVATTTRYKFHEPMRPGDRIYQKVKLATVSPEKKTRLGTGYFLTAEQAYTNQNDDLICVQSFTVLTFKPAL